MRWFGGITGSMNMSLSKLQEMVKDRGAWHAAVHGVAKQMKNNSRASSDVLTKKLRCSPAQSELPMGVGKPWGQGLLT